MKVGDVVISDNSFVNIIEYIDHEDFYDGVCIADFVTGESTPYKCCNDLHKSVKLDQELLSILYGLEV